VVRILNGWNNAGIINITSNAASFTFTASLSSNWTCGPYDVNHTWYLDNYPDALLATTDATAQSETAYHFNLSYGNQCIYCSANLFQTNNSHSGCLNIDRYDYPTVTLVSPEDNSIDTDGEINFTYEPIGYYNDIANCSLWGNWSGSWIVNQTNISVIINDSTNWFDTINLTTNGDHGWNVLCYGEKSFKQLE